MPAEHGSESDPSLSSTMPRNGNRKIPSSPLTARNLTHRSEQINQALLLPLLLIEVHLLIRFREQLFRLRFKHQLGNTDVVRQLQTARKDLARIKTEARARELAEATEAGTRLPRHRSRAERRRRTEARHNAEARAKRN